MKNLFKITFLGLALASFSASASINIKSLELIDSTVIDGSQISAITLNNFDSSIESVETSDGDFIQGSEIKSISTFKIFSKFGMKASVAKIGGEGSGN